MERIVTAMVVWSQIGIIGYLLGPLAGGLVAAGPGYAFIGLVPAAAGVLVEPSCEAAPPSPPAEPAAAVPGVGFEPTRPFEQGLLRTQCLPIPPPGGRGRSYGGERRRAGYAGWTWPGPTSPRP